eukprot:Hpha_TRINITY_DN7705_c0_g2::TRINITY_DN7705_c0_g2_i2::g.85413::m.85413/K00546/HNMT; histamine N-methyltransferase
MVQTKPPICGELSDEQYADFFVLRRNFSTMWQSQSKAFCSVAAKLRSVVGSGPMRVLSVGAGDGDQDVEFIDILRQTIPGVELEYVALEPNTQHFNRLKSIPGITPRPLTFDQFMESQIDSARFHLVHFVHIVHWLPDIPSAVRRARSLLSPGGKVLIVQQSESGVPKLVPLAVRAGLLQCLPPYCCPVEKVQAELTAAGMVSELDVVPGELNMTEVFKGSPAGLGLLSFLLCRDVSAAVGAVRQFLEAVNMQGLVEQGKMREDVGMLLM